MKTTGRYARHAGAIKTAAALLSLLMLLSFSAGCGRRSGETDIDETGTYKALPAPDYLSYTGFGQVTSLLGVDNVLALYKDVKLVYYRAGLTETAEPFLKEEDGALKLNAAECAKMLGKEDGRGWIDAVSGAQLASDLTVTI